MLLIGLALTRKRKIVGMADTDVPYGVTTPPPEVTTPPLPEGVTSNSCEPAGIVELPWWADFIDSHGLADLIRNQCDKKVRLIGHVNVDILEFTNDSNTKLSQSLIGCSILSQQCSKLVG